MYLLKSLTINAKATEPESTELQFIDLKIINPEEFWQSDPA